VLTGEDVKNIPESTYAYEMPIWLISGACMKRAGAAVAAEDSKRYEALKRSKWDMNFETGPDREESLKAKWFS
jgi:hypothetical protein